MSSGLIRQIAPALMFSNAPKSDLDTMLAEIERIRKLLDDMEARGERPSEEIEDQLRIAEELVANMSRPVTKH